MNTMKAGVKNCGSDGKSGPIPSQKAQQRVDDYYVTLQAEHPDDFAQRKSESQLDPVVLYKSSEHGLAHGRVPIANGAIRKSDLKGFARTNTTSQANSRSYQYLVRRNAQLERNSQRDSHIALILSKHMKDIYEKMNVEVPAEIAEIGDLLQEANANTSMPPIDQGTESSHAGNATPGCHDINGVEDNEGDTNIE